jgi:hypothetical protein
MDRIRNKQERATGVAGLSGRAASLGEGLIGTMRRDKQDVLLALRRHGDPAELLGNYYERVDAALAWLRQLRTEYAGKPEETGRAAAEQALPWDDGFLEELERELRIQGRWAA